MSTFGLRLYRRTLATVSRDFQAAWLEEAVSTLQMAMANERRTRGAAAAVWLWLRAMADAVGLAGHGEHGGAFMGWGQDLRQSIRGLNRSRHYAATVVVTLALAIGGVTAVFRLADPLLFQRLPFPAADQLYTVAVSSAGTSTQSQFPDYFRTQKAGVFAGMGTFFGPIPAALDGASEDAEDSLAFAVTTGFLDMLGAGVQRGRAFLPSEYASAPLERGVFDVTPGAPVLITDAVWNSQFGRRDDIVGQRLMFESRRERRSMTVVGVLARDFVLPTVGYKAPAFLVPGRLDAAAENDKRSVVAIYGRLRPGVTAAATAAQVTLIMSSVERDYPTLPQRRGASLVSLQTTLFAPVRVPLMMLLSVTAGVLILAVGNLAHLSLGRSTGRVREVAVRSALGGGRWPIMRLLMTEALILAAISILISLGLSAAIFASVMAVVPRLGHIYRLVPANMNLRVVLFAVTLGAVAWMAFGLVPALRTVGADVRGALQQNSRGARGRRRAANQMLTALQAALGTSVLVVMILLVVSFARLVTSVDGIDENGLMMASVELPRDYAAAPERRVALLREIEARAERASGQAIGWQGGLPGTTVSGGLWRTADTDATPVAMAYPIDQTGMVAFGLRLRAGRFFTDEEAHTNAPVAVIDQRTSDILWPGESPLGRMVYDAQVRTEGATAREVVGVIETLRIDFSREPTPGGRAFVPFHTKSNAGALTWRGTAGPEIVQSLRDSLRELEPRARVKVAPIEPFERRFGEPRLLARVIGVIGLLALVLTVTGVYSVTSHATSGRTAEIGVRMALGANALRVRAMIVREALWPAAIGILVGGVAAFWWAVRLKGLLFEIAPRSPWVCAAASTVVMVVVVFASGIPATRASRLNPVDALRAD